MKNCTRLSRISAVALGLSIHLFSSAQAGALDASFDGDGIVETPVGVGDAYARGVAVQADDKIVTAGYSDDGTQDVFTVIRYNSDGSLDNSFDGDGSVNTQIGTSGNRAHALLIQPDNKIVVAGYSYSNASGNDFALARYNPDGSLDLSFDSDGIAITAMSGTSNDRAFSITIQSDGKLLVAGYTTDLATGQRDFAVARYTINGSLDPSFDADGIAVLSVETGNDEARAVVVQTDGKIVLAGYAFDFSTRRFTVVRFTPDGSLDPSFDSDGIVTTSIGLGSMDDAAYSALIQPDGKIILAGYSHGATYDYALVRYLSDGSLDPAFDSDGIVVTSIGTAGSSSDEARAIFLQNDGKIVLAGHSDYDFSLARYTSDGILDATFDSDGTLTTDIASPSFYDNIEAIALHSNGKIVVAGSSSNETNYTFTLARYTNNLLAGSDFLDENGAEFDVFPNPFSTSTTIKTNSFPEGSRITILTIDGCFVEEFKHLSQQPIIFNRGELPAGVYVVCLSRDLEILARKKLVITN